MPTAMFPLGSVLVPGMVMPLHVFEDRYRALTRHCIESTEPFGVTLIERGSEVGGGETRFNVGCLASIVESHLFDDGRYALLTVGTERFVVEEWLPDDPYPLAEIAMIREDDEDCESALVDDVRRRLRQTLAIASEVGVDAAPATMDLSDDPVALSWEVAAAAPFQAIDRQMLLATPTAEARLETEIELLDRTAEVLRAQIN